MTRHKQLHILLFLLAAIFTACKPPVDPKAQLRKAERNIETNPEAALASLDSVLNPDLSLRHADHIKYILLHAEATYLSFKEVKNDTAIFEACRYYEKKQDLPQLTKATLYSACVLEAQGQTDAAVDAYNKAFALASQNADSALMAKAKHYLGNLNYYGGYYDEALKNFKQAEKYYANNLSKKAQMHRAIGSAFTLKHENDSAVRYLEKGLELARVAEDEMEESYILNTLSIIYREKGDYEESFLLLRQSVSVGVAENDSIRLHLNYADLFLDMDEMDSAGYYAGKLKSEVKNVADGPEQAAIYAFLSEFESIYGCIDSAFVYEQQHTQALDKEYHRRLQQSVYEAQLKYDFEAQQNRHYLQLASRRRVILFLVVGLFAMAVFVAVVMYRNARKNKALAHALDELLTFKQKSGKIQENYTAREKDWSDLMTSYENRLERELRFRQTVMQQLDIVSKNRGEKSYLLDLEKTVFGSRNHWDEMMAVFDELYPGLRASVQEHYPQLNEMERNDFVLSVIGVSRSDEAFLLGVSVSVVDKMRSKVKKITGKGPDAE